MPDAKHLIRNLTETDIMPCVRLYQRAYELPCYGGTWDEPEAERIIRDLCRVFPHECWVAERDGVLQGFILCSSLAGMRASVEEFAVAPECQGQGVGSALLDFVMDHYRRQGLTYIELVANCHAPAYEFYRRRGFAESQDYRLMSRHL
jgi:ribosomal protein S18 acetylase RimI-like enzyme